MSKNVLLVSIVFIACSLALPMAARFYRKKLPNWVWLGLDVILIFWVSMLALVSTFLFADISAIALSGEYKRPIASALLLSLFIAALPFKLRRGGVAILGMIICAILISDLIYIRAFGNIISPFLWQGISQIDDVFDSITALWGGEEWMFVAFALLSIILAILWPGRRVVTGRQKNVQTIIQLSSVTLIILLGSYEARSLYWYMQSDRSWKVFAVTKQVHTGGIINAHYIDLARSVREWWTKGKLSEKEINETISYFKQNNKDRLMLSSQSFGIANGANVIVIQVEALQEWVIGTIINDEAVTPFLNKLKSQALYFSGVFDQTGDSPTSDSLYSVLNSQHPLGKGAVAFRRQNNHFVAIPHLLSQLGYKTLYAHAADRGFWNIGVVTRKYGFDERVFKEEIGDGEEIGWGLADHIFFERMVERIEDIERPFLGYLVTLASHDPYNYIPLKYRKLETRGIEGTQLANYIQSIHYVDEALSALFDRLDDAGMLLNTLVVIFGDHDARLQFDAELTKKASSVTNLDEKSLTRIGQRHPLMRRVPLFMVFPGASITGLNYQFGGHVDIAPTILHYMGIQSPKSFIGRPLISGNEAVVSRVDGMVIGNGLIYVPAFVSAADKIAHEEKCLTYENVRLKLSLCEELIQEGLKELIHSHRVTLNDLAKRVERD